MSTATIKNHSTAEYLAFERGSEIKHEYFDGEIFAMTGASEAHNLIQMNVATALHQLLASSPCRVYPSDMRIRCSTGLYTYPDVSVVCEQSRLEDDARDTLLNPLVIIEVLSPSTAGYDRGTKFEHYRTISSLREYVLVSQDRFLVEHFARQSDSDHWLLTTTSDLTASVSFPVLNVDVQLAEIYAKVDATSQDKKLRDRGTLGPDDAN